MKKTLVHALILSGVLTLTGCAATSTAISHRNLDVTTKMSDSIFLEPVAPAQQGHLIIYLGNMITL